eukprot:TRINITY_DN1334_c0_g2_i3.p1 TRINITY_DN1334_c0_g2~~TRINITY_DN1334_c0_g2_i3.p1  ORF type:complete len:254 (+),score=76.11 TRINITY_DN1334_c0_g2_i3:102-863(+)
MGGGPAVESYRILKVKPNSPSSDIPIEEMLDFLIHSTEVNGAYTKFDDYVAANENKEIELTFFNIASQKEWKHKMMPKKWEGSGLIGVTLHPETYQDAHNKVIHILDVMVDSPMHKAGFKPYSEYIIGTRDLTFEDVHDFTEFIQSNNNKPVDLVVYDSKEQTTRVRTLVPNSQWGGAGSLGGEVGFGYAHSLPVRKSKAAAEDKSDDESKTEEAKATKETAKEQTEGSIEMSGISEEDILIGSKEPAKAAEL